MALDVDSLKRAEVALYNLDQAAAYLPRRPFGGKLTSCIRKLRIARELSDVYYVAVAGLQSAGKTRLMKELYGISDDWLPDNAGRGERVPVFIIEDDIGAPRATQVMPGMGLDTEQELSPEQFRTLIRQWDPASEALFPKLYVPRRHFEGYRVGFVLLPGYEHVNKDNAAWQHLMGYALRHALGCLVVTDQTRLADHSQARIVEDMARQLEGRAPLIAITKSEHTPSDGMAALRDRALEVFQVANHPSPQVVFTGTGDPAYVASWTAELIEGLKTHAANASVSAERRYGDIEELVDEEVNEVIESIAEAMEIGAAGQSQAAQHRERVLQAFVTSKEKYRRQFERTLSASIADHANDAIAACKQAYHDQEEGFNNKVFSNTARFFTTSAGEREEIHIKRIKDAWAGRSVQASDVSALGKLSSSFLKTDPVTDRKAIAGESLTPAQMLGYVEKDESILDSEQLRSMMVRLLDTKRNTDLPAEQQDLVASGYDSEDFRTLVGLIPAYTMEFLRISGALTLYATGKGHTVSPLTSEESLVDVMIKTSEDLPRFAATTTSILKNIACILAIDIAADGKIDTIPALLQAFFGTAGSGAATAGATTAGTAAAGAGAAMSTAVTGVLIMAYVAYQGTTAAQRHDAAHRAYIAEAIQSLAQTHVARWLDLYDDAMERVYDRLHAGLSSAYMLDAELGQHDTLLRNIANARRARLSLVRSVRGIRASILA